MVLSLLYLFQLSTKKNAGIMSKHRRLKYILTRPFPSSIAQGGVAYTERGGDALMDMLGAACVILLVGMIYFLLKFIVTSNALSA